MMERVRSQVRYIYRTNGMWNVVISTYNQSIESSGHRQSCASSLSNSHSLCVGVLTSKHRKNIYNEGERGGEGGSEMIMLARSVWKFLIPSANVTTEERERERDDDNEWNEQTVKKYEAEEEKKHKRRRRWEVKKKKWEYMHKSFPHSFNHPVRLPPLTLLISFIKLKQTSRQPAAHNRTNRAKAWWWRRWCLMMMWWYGPTHKSELSTTHRLSPISGAVVRPELFGGWTSKRMCSVQRVGVRCVGVHGAAPAAASERANERGRRREIWWVLCVECVFFSVGSLEFGYRYTLLRCVVRINSIEILFTFLSSRCSLGFIHFSLLLLATPHSRVSAQSLSSSARSCTRREIEPSIR